MIRSYSFQNSRAFPMACATFETTAQKTLGTLACSAIYDSFSWNASLVSNFHTIHFSPSADIHQYDLLTKYQNLGYLSSDMCHGKKSRCKILKVPRQVYISGSWVPKVPRQVYISGSWVSKVPRQVYISGSWVPKVSCQVCISGSWVSRVPRQIYIHFRILSS